VSQKVRRKVVMPPWLVQININDYWLRGRSE